jgi:hypothetical protein
MKRTDSWENPKDSERRGKERQAQGFGKARRRKKKGRPNDFADALSYFTSIY